jgi:small-conductance mechanosensitive channel
MLDMDNLRNIALIISTIFCIYSFRVAYLVGFKQRFDLLYSIDQVKTLHMDSRKRLMLSIGIASIYIITGIGFVITCYNIF